MNLTTTKAPPPPPPEPTAEPLPGNPDDSPIQLIVETKPPNASKECSPCEAARRAQEAAMVKAVQDSKKTLGLVSMLTAKTGKIVSDSLRKMRLAICHTCPETERGTTVKLFRRIEGHEYCGLPRLANITKIYRDETEIGCGCDVADKTRYELAQCPRGRWGPGPLMGPQYTVKVQQTRVIKDVVDVQVQFAQHAGQEADMYGIGDTIAALPMVHAVQRKYPTKRVRMRIVPMRLDWARCGWPDVVSSDDWSITPEWWVHLNPYRLMQLHESCMRYGMNWHQMWSATAGVDEPVKDIGLAPNQEATEWGKAQFIGTEGKPIVCIAPFSTVNQRNWPLHHWVDLADMLTKAGCFVYFVDGPEQNRTKFVPFLRYWGWGPQHVLALFKRTDLVLGNDSSMCHLGGVMRRPTIAICSSSPGKVVFGWYDTVRVLQTPAACSVCNMNGGRGYRSACNEACEAMWDLKPSVVLGHAMDILKGAKP